MKKFFIALLLLGSSFAQTKACDICGCGVSNYNPFLFPHLSRNYVSISYIHRLYHMHPDDGMDGNEFYNTVLIAGQYSLGRKLQFVAMVPYQVNQLMNDNGTKKVSGLGDASLLVNYTLWNKTTKATSQV